MKNKFYHLCGSDIHQLASVKTITDKKDSERRSVNVFVV